MFATRPIASVGATSLVAGTGLYWFISLFYAGNDLLLFLNPALILGLEAVIILLLHLGAAGTIRISTDRTDEEAESR